MPTNSQADSTEAAILTRVINPDDASFSPEVARSILKFKFCRADLTKMKRLAAKARKGSLRPAEDTELNNYLHVGRFLALVQAKARRSLQQHRRSAS